MNLERAQEILKEAITPEGGLDSLGMSATNDHVYIHWTPRPFSTSVCLDGDFTVEELEAIAFWLRAKGEELVK